MPKLHGIRERYAQIAVKAIGEEIYAGDLTMSIAGMTLLPDAHYRPPGHPERSADPGVSVWLESSASGVRYFQAPALVHMDRYCMRHNNMDSGPLGDYVRALIERRQRVEKGGEDETDNKATEAIMTYRKDHLSTIPVLIPVRGYARTWSSKHLDAFVCLDILWTRDVC